MSIAAKKLFMTQPAVSQTIKDLENYYETILFNRFPQKLFITDAGMELFSIANHMISLFEESKTKLKEVEKKEILRIGVNITVGTTMIQNYIKEYSRLYKNVKLQILVNNALIIKEKLRRNQLDFALLEEGKEEPYFISEVFFEDRIVVIANNNNPLILKEKLYFKDIINQDFLLRESGSGVRDTFERLALLKGTNIIPTWESCSSKALVNAVIDDFGIAVLPYRIAKEYIEQKQVIELNIEDMNLNRKLLIVYHKNKLLSNGAENFIKIVKTVDIK